MNGLRAFAALVLIACVAAAAPASAQQGEGLLAKIFRKQPAAEQPQQAPQPASAARQAPAITENTGELRSKEQPVRRTLFGRALGGEALLPETQALDAVQRGRDTSKPFAVRPEFEPQSVAFGGYKPGTIVIDTGGRYLYLIENRSSARRYAIAVGREGLEFKGKAVVGDKQEWPRWFPTKAMQEREPHKYARYKDGMNGGPDNPLGARAIYLHQSGRDTHVRIHGTNQPQTIGTNSSNGCFRMINEHVIDLYRRVPKGAEVVVL